MEYQIDAAMDKIEESPDAKDDLWPAMKFYAFAALGLQYADIIHFAVKQRDSWDAARFGSGYLFGAVAAGTITGDTQSEKFNRVTMALAWCGLAAAQLFFPLEDWKNRLAIVIPSAICTLASTTTKEDRKEIGRKIKYNANTIYYAIFQNKKPLGR